jgi:GntR family transcriptional regulator
MEITEEIMKKIQEGTYGFEENLPSEADLARELNVGRSTIREALKIMQRDNVLFSRNGVGAYINKKDAMISNSLNRLKSLGEMIQNAGYEESESDVKIYTMEPEDEWAEKLQTEKNVFVIERTRTADVQNVAFYYNILPSKFDVSSINENFSGGILPFLEQYVGLKAAYAITEICTIDETAERDRKALEILDLGIILLKQLHYDVNGIPFLYSLDYLKSSSFNLTVNR